MLKKIISLVLVMAITASLAITGTVAYLQSDDSNVNVMTLGNVKIEQHEYQRVENAEGVYETQEIDDVTSYVLEDFDQGKPLYPIVGDPSTGAAGWDGTIVRMTQVDSYGSMQVFAGKNAQDKFVTVENTGKSDAYIRTLVAIEVGTGDASLIGTSYHGTWSLEEIGTIVIDDVNYYVTEYLYNGGQLSDGSWRHKNGILPAGDTSYPNLSQVYLKSVATNEDMEKLDGNGNGTLDILVLSQAVQAEGFDDATKAFDAAFPKGTDNENVAEWFGGITVPNLSTTASEMNAIVTELPDGTDITKNVSKLVYGKTSDYPEIVNGNYETATLDNATAYYVPNGTNYDVYMLSDGVIYAPVNSKNLFRDMSNVTEIDTSNLDFSLVENALCMFANCSKLETLDTASWDVSNMTNMQSIFYGCNNLEDIDISNWDTSNVTNMRMVFFRCYKLPNEVLKGVENWDVSNVSNFYSMFKHAHGLTSLDLSKWDTSNATNMSHLFANIGDLEYLDLSGFDTSKVTDMSWMFYGASNLKTILVGDGWTTAAVAQGTPTPFYNNQALVGGEGTTWMDVCDMANAARPWESSAKIDYAIVDGGTENPGLLTHK